MELRSVSWIDVMLMPYDAFMSDLKWKIDLEEEKRKRIEEAKKSPKNKASNALKQRGR